MPCFPKGHLVKGIILPGLAPLASPSSVVHSFADLLTQSLMRTHWDLAYNSMHQTSTYKSTERN